MLTKEGKRSNSYEEQAMAKKRKIGGDEIITGTFSPKDFPVLSSGCFPICLEHGLSSMELKRASESILDQVNWSEVVLDTAAREKAAIRKSS